MLKIQKIVLKNTKKLVLKNTKKLLLKNNPKTIIFNFFFSSSKKAKNLKKEGKTQLKCNKLYKNPESLFFSEISIRMSKEITK